VADLAYQALQYFQTSITAFDVTQSKVSGRLQEVDGADYTFVGVIQPPNDSDLQILPEGIRSDVQLMLHTLYPGLNIADGDVSATVQSYIRWNDNRVYKVVDLGDFSQWRIKRYALINIERGR
jgi:hypothetical protein